MKQRLALLTLLVLGTLTAFSQTSENEFLRNLTAFQNGQGTVHIYQDERLPRSIADRHTYNENTDIPYVLISGYRVQAYSSNVPKTARSEAFAMEEKIKEKMPDVPSYVSFASPFWKVRMGDCRTYQEAMTLLGNMKRIFPEYKSNFYIVKEDNIRIPIK